LKIGSPLSKMKPYTRRGPKIGKKNIRELYVQNFDNQGNAIVGAHMKQMKQMANNSWTIPIRIGSMVTHFQLPPYEFH
jgi:hypothetical protein